MDESKSTSASRMKKMREKAAKENPFFQQEENKRISELKRKKKSCMTDAERLKLRQYERERKRLQRERKRQNSSQSMQPSTSTANTVSPAPPTYNHENSDNILQQQCLQLAEILLYHQIAQNYQQI